LEYPTFMGSERAENNNPDSTPDTNSGKSYPIEIRGTQLIIGLKALANEYGVQEAVVFRRLIEVILIAKTGKENGHHIIITRDILAKETALLDLFAEKVQEPNNDPGLKVRKSLSLGPLTIKRIFTGIGRMRFVLPSTIHDEFAELANMHHTTVEAALAATFNLGIDLAYKEKRGEISLLIKSRNRSDRGFSIVDFGKQDN